MGNSGSSGRQTGRPAIYRGARRILIPQLEQFAWGRLTRWAEIKQIEGVLKVIAAAGGHFAYLGGPWVWFDDECAEEPPIVVWDAADVRETPAGLVGEIYRGGDQVRELGVRVLHCHSGRGPHNMANVRGLALDETGESRKAVYVVFFIPED